MTGQWVRRRAEESTHDCQLPTHAAVYRLPSASLAPPQPRLPDHIVEQPEHISPVPDGQLGDLWRCSCGQLWRIGMSCDACDLAWRGGPGFGRVNASTGRCARGGYHPVGLRWRPATWWQRMRHRA